MFEITKAEDISILHLFGEISLLEMEFIQKQIQSLKKYKHTKILLDLANVDYVHFQAVKHWATSAEELTGLHGGGLKLANVSVDTKQMIQFIGADQTLKDYETTADAILSFLQPPKVSQYGLDELDLGRNHLHRNKMEEVSRH